MKGPKINADYGRLVEQLILMLQYSNNKRHAIIPKWMEEEKEEDIN